MVEPVYRVAGDVQLCSCAAVNKAKKRPSVAVPCGGRQPLTVLLAAPAEDVQKRGWTSTKADNRATNGESAFDVSGDLTPVARRQCAKFRRHRIPPSRRLRIKSPGGDGPAGRLYQLVEVAGISGAAQQRWALLEGELSYHTWG